MCRCADHSSGGAVEEASKNPKSGVVRATVVFATNTDQHKTKMANEIDQQVHSSPPRLLELSTDDGTTPF